MAMDAREQDGSQSGLPAIKRHRDEGRTMESGKRDEWQRALLPPIDSETLGRPHQVRHVGMVELAANSYQNPYTRELAEPEAKRPRYEQNEYHTGPGVNGQQLHPRPSHAMYDTNQPHGQASPPAAASRAPLHLQPARFSPQQRRGVFSEWEAVTRRQSTDDALRPTQIATPEDNTDLCRHCRNALALPENLESVTQAAATALYQLAETLGSGISSNQRLSFMTPSQREKAEAYPKDYPPISQSGLENTLNWLLGRIHHINALADTFVQGAPSGGLQIPQTQTLRNGDSPLAHNPEIMKRRLEPEADPYRVRAEAPDPALDVKMYPSQGERQSKVEDHLSVRSQYNYRPFQQQDGPDLRDRGNPRNQRDYRDPRVSIMTNPLLTITRQSPSPGRSIPSPTSISFPSPSTSAFGSTSQPVNLPPPSSLQHSPTNGYLPPIGSARPDSAMQAHSAALQHEVSVQKIALSTLQTEHDKLLAAYLRSQTRASTLEKKQNVTDSEIISLSEEKSRLQEFILELEKNIEELTKSREECRQAAVQEGKQYIEIVKKASQLEIMAAKDKESWNASRVDLEQQVATLKSKGGQHHGIGSMDAKTPNSSISHDREGSLPPLDAVNTHNIATAAAPTSEPGFSNVSTKQSADMDRIRVLDEDVRRLRHRVVEMETALNAVRDDSQSMGKLVEALGATGKSMLGRASRVLETSIVG